jgi:protein suppressor of PHYA-105 1
MEGTTAAEVGGAADGAAGDVQIKGSKENGQQPEEQQQPSVSEALEMPATPLPRDIDWSEHFSFFTSLGGFGSSSDGARGLTSVGLSNSESRPDSVTQGGLDNDDAEERVEELTLKNCIAADVQPEVSAGGSSSSGDRPTVIKGLWGNFTRMAWRTSELASRENAAVSYGDVANLRAGDASSRENLGTCLANNIISRNNDVSVKEAPMSRVGNANNEFMMPFRSQQLLLSARPNQIEQRPERDNAIKVSSFSNRILEQLRSKTVTPPPAVLGSPPNGKSKGKGVVYQGAREEVQVQANARPRVPSDKIPTIPTSKHDSMARVDPLLFSAGGNVSKSHCEGTSLRELIKPGRQTLSKFEKMHLFKQILDLVDKCHTQGYTLQHLRPSYFTIPSSNQVKYIGSYTTQDLPTSIKQDVAREDLVNRKRCLGQKSDHQESNGHRNSMLKYQKVGDQGSVAVRRPTHTFWTDQRGHNQNEDVNQGVLRQENYSYTVRERFKFVEPYGSNTSCAQHVSSSGNQQLPFELRNLEESWYMSPEELSQFKGTFSSNIYSLGVLLFEVCMPIYLCDISAVVLVFGFRRSEVTLCNCNL